MDSTIGQGLRKVDGIQVQNGDSLRSLYDELAGIPEPHSSNCSIVSGESDITEIALKKCEDAIRVYLDVPETSRRLLSGYDGSSFARRNKDGDDEHEEEDSCIISLRDRLKAYEQCAWLRKKQQDSRQDDADDYKTAVHDIAEALNSMGNLYMLGRSYKEAFLCYNSSLKIRTEATTMVCACEGDSQGHLTDLLRTKSNIGVSLCKMGRHQRALETFMDLLASVPKQVLGDDAAAVVASTLNRMANVYFKMKSYKMAIKFYEKALLESSSCQNAPEENPHLNRDIGITFNIALAYYRSEKYRQALKSFTKVLFLQTSKGDQRSSEGTSAPDMDTVVSNAINMALGMSGETNRTVYDVKGDLAVHTSERHGQDLKTTRKSSVVRKHVIDVVHALRYVGLIKCKLEKWDEALYIFQPILHVTKQIKGEGHPQVGKILMDIICIEVALQEYDEARRTCCVALNIFQNEANASQYHRHINELRKSLEIIECEAPPTESNDSSNTSSSSRPMHQDVLANCA